MSGTDSSRSTIIEPRPTNAGAADPDAPVGGATPADSDPRIDPANPGAQGTPPASTNPIEALGLAPSIEAALFASERALSAARLAQALLGPEPVSDTGEEDRRRSAAPEAVRRVEGCVKELNAEYERTGRAFRIESVPGGYRVMTLARFAPALARLSALRPPARLSRAAIETLSIIAYRQPIGRAQLEAIRGVACGEVLKSLIERRLVTITGRAEELGRPMLYGTTRQFLDAFGLASLADLPQEGELAGPRQDG